MPRSVQEEPERLAGRSAQGRTGAFPFPMAAPDLSDFFSQYRPMLRILSSADLVWLKGKRPSELRQFRKERTAIYFQYLGDLRRDLRALLVWAAPHDAQAFTEMDKASWTMYGLLVKLVLEGLLYYCGIQQRDNGAVERCFKQLGNVLSAAA